MSHLIEQFERDMVGQSLYKQDGSFSQLLLGNILPGCMPPYITRYYDNFDFRSFIFLMQKSFGAVFFSLDCYKHTTRTTFQRLLAKGDVASLEEVKDFYRIQTEIRQLYDQYSIPKLEHIGDAELAVAVEQIFHQIFSLLAATVFCESLDEDLTKMLYKESGGDFEHLSEFVSISSRVGFESFAVRFDQALLDYVDDTQSYETQWLLCDYYIAPGLDRTAGLMAALIKGRGDTQKIKEDYAKITREIHENEEVISKYKETLSGKMRQLFEFIQLSIFIRDVRKEPFQRIHTLLSNVARECFKRAGLSVEDVIYALSGDLLKGSYKNENYKKELDRRKKGMLVYTNADNAQLEYGDIEKSKQQIFQVMHHLSGEVVTEIKGSVAFPGLVKASVSVILSKQDFDKFVDGSVLVTSMTRPEFLPLMKKAVAVVTDEGGITCHAAIVSRELKIPCVIGTKIATHILKDGDLVEVDADHGIVRKI